MAELKLNVDLRSGTGKNVVGRLRREEGFVPGIIYGSGEEPRNVKVDKLVFDRVYRVAGESTLVDLVVDGDTIPVLIKDVQTHPYRDEYIHIDFQQLDMTQTVRMTVPITLIGRDDIDVEEAVLMQQLDEVEIETLPGDIPESVEVDVTEMTLEEPVFVSDLNIFGDERYVILTEEDDVIASLIIPTEEVEEDELDEAIDADDVPVIGEEDEEAEETEADEETEEE